MTKQEYAQWTQEESPKSKGPMNILKAFVPSTHFPNQQPSCKKSSYIL